MPPCDRVRLPPAPARTSTILASSAVLREHRLLMRAIAGLPSQLARALERERRMRHAPVPSAFRSRDRSFITPARRQAIRRRLSILGRAPPPRRRGMVAQELGGWQR